VGVYLRKTFLLISITISGVLFAATTVLADPKSPPSTAVDGTDLNQIGIIFERLLAFLFSIAGAFAIIMIVVGAIRYMISSGDPKAVASARATITFAVIGLIIILLAVAIVLIIGNFLGVPNLDLIKLSTS